MTYKKIFIIVFVIVAAFYAFRWSKENQRL